MSTTNEQQTTGTQQQWTDEEILDKERKKMDYFYYRWYAYNNKTRKKLKRWFDRCRKRKLGDNSVKVGECCYKIERPANVIYMGKKASTNANHEFQPPYLIIDKDGYILHYQKESGSQQEESKRLLQMSYDEFYKLYRKAVGKIAPLEWFLNVYDGFMSWTQVPRQLKTKEGTKAESVGGHVANIAARVFSPVLAAGIGLYAGAKAAYKGAKALKDKIIPTEEELADRRFKLRNNYKLEDERDEQLKNSVLLYGELKNANDRYKKDLADYNQHIDQIFNNHAMNIKEHITTAEEYKKWYKKNILEYDLKDINRIKQTQQQLQ